MTQILVLTHKIDLQSKEGSNTSNQQSQLDNVDDHTEDCHTYLQKSVSNSVFLYVLAMLNMHLCDSMYIHDNIS